MASVTRRLTAEDRNQLQNHTLVSNMRLPIYKEQVLVAYGVLASEG